MSQAIEEFYIVRGRNELQRMTYKEGKEFLNRLKGIDADLIKCNVVSRYYKDEIEISDQRKVVNQFKGGSQLDWLTHLRKLIMEGKTGQAAGGIDLVIAFFHGFEAFTGQSPNHYKPNSKESVEWYRGYDAARMSE